MAQWMWQYSGFTHKTKVRDTEDSLRLAIKAVVEASPVDRDRKTRAMWRLAERVLQARLKALGARIDALTEPCFQHPCGVSKLQEKEQKLRAQGVEGILREFGAPENPQ